MNTYNRLYHILNRRPTKEEYETYRNLYRRKSLTVRAYCRRHKISPTDILIELNNLNLSELESYSCKYIKSTKTDTSDEVVDKKVIED